MQKTGLLFILLFAYFGYSAYVYTAGTDMSQPAQKREAMAGKQIFQDYNCIACHQVYGLGGYLGTDLTNAWSDKKRGEAYMRAILKSGGNRMPNFRFTDRQIEHLIAYFKYVDQSAVNNKP